MASHLAATLACDVVTITGASHILWADWKTELTGRVLVLVAHADDESVGYGALLQQMREAVVVIATDGAPRDEYFWERFGSREAYAAVRRDEARRAMQVAGVRELVLLAEEDSRLEDQQLVLESGGGLRAVGKAGGAGEAGGNCHPRL